MSGEVLLSRGKHLASKLLSRMSNFTYEDAVQKLNSLQSNKAAIERIRKEIRAGEQKCTNIQDMENYLLRSGLTLSKLDELSVIHVAGTKGKGSTSAMCESVLRHHGYRTGFYSSPHLVAVRERIRLDGQVIGRDAFAGHLHRVYDLLEASKAYPGDMPGYFAFLTVLAFDVFLKEKVDVAIVEVGIGGTVDYTNVLRKVPVVGITALGLDHTSILGNTLEDIAAAKAGIMKPGCQAYTVPQPPAAMEVLQRVATDVQCSVHIVPDYKAYAFPEDCKKELPVDLDAFYSNASLAIQLAHAWMRAARHPTFDKTFFLKTGKHNLRNGFTELIEKNTTEVAEPIVTKIPTDTVLGLRRCRWPGRYQVIKADYADFYFDGAHTKESMEICAKWFASQLQDRNQQKNLIFSATGDRNSELLLKPLTFLNFNKIYFVIPTAYKEVNNKNDNFSLQEQKELISKCQTHAQIWNILSDSNKTETIVLESVSEALIHIKRSNNLPSVLITGSLHLVGAALSILDSNLSQ